MLLAMEDEDFAALIAGTAPRGLCLPDSPLAPVEVLEMLRALAGSVAAEFTPAAWMIVEADEILGICSLLRPPSDGQIAIGYGVAPTRQGRGATGRAIAELVVWAQGDDRVDAVLAETGVGNLPSQRVLSRNGFRQTGTRTDAEDGPVICWQIATRD